MFAGVDRCLPGLIHPFELVFQGSLHLFPNEFVRPDIQSFYEPQDLWKQADIELESECVLCERGIEST
jgi:hypothetical protein